MEDNQDIFDWIRALRASDLPEIDVLKAYFERIVNTMVGFAEHEIELAKAMQDRESLVKHQIKMETLKSAREIFGQGYQVATGRKAWDEQDGR